MANPISKKAFLKYRFLNDAILNPENANRKEMVEDDINKLSELFDDYLEAQNKLIDFMTDIDNEYDDDGKIILR